MANYDKILDLLANVPSAIAGGTRDITWVSDSRNLAVARDQGGRLELFLTGKKLCPTSPDVEDALEFHEWHRSDGAPLPANRLLLPALGYYDPVASFICTELLRNGVDQDVEVAFAKTEPIIDLAIERLHLSQAALLGLAGELLLLRAMCQRSDGNLVGDVIRSWDGWRRSARDFHWNKTGVEVKTTMRPTSTHLVQGVHQVERAEGDDDSMQEDRLLLVSAGLQRSEPSPNSFSVPSLVQGIVERLEETGNSAFISEFLTCVGRYGSESGFGYDHKTMAHDAPFTSTLSTRFFRGYDMVDPAVRVIRGQDIRDFHHVDPQSVRFRVSLPAMISSSNPIAGANQVASWVLGLK